MKPQSIPDPATFDTKAAFHGFVNRSVTGHDPRVTLWEEKIRPLCVYTILRFRKTVDLRDYLDELKIFDALLAEESATPPGSRFKPSSNGKGPPKTDPKYKKTQTLLFKTRRWLYLPPLLKGSARGTDYEVAMQRWKVENAEPTDEMILSGWRPKRPDYSDLNLNFSGSTQSSAPNSARHGKQSDSAAITKMSAPPLEAVTQEYSDREPATPSQSPEPAVKDTGRSFAEELQKISDDVKSGAVPGVKSSRKNSPIYVHQPKPTS